LRIRPRGKAGVFVECAAGDAVLRAHRPLGFDRGKGGETDAREQYDEGPAKAGEWQRRKGGRYG
jgi:hypothetical protein